MKVNQLKAGVVLSYLQMGIGTVIQLVYTPVMLRLLGQSEYGLYSLVSSVISYLGLLSFGFSSSYVRFYSRYRVKNDEKAIAVLNGMFLTVFSVITVISLVSGSVLVMNTEHIFKGGLTAAEIGKTKILMSVLVVNISITFPVNVFSSYISVNEQFVFQRAVNMLKTILNPFLALPLLLLGYKSMAMVVVTLVITIIADTMNILYSIKKLKIHFSFRHFNFGLLKEMWIFSFYIFLNMITDQINWSADKFLLGMVKSSAAIAVYGVASQLNAFYRNFSVSVSSVFVPKVNKLVADSNDNTVLTSLFTRVGRIQFIILFMILSGYVVFGRYFIAKWAGAGYEASYRIGLLLMIPVTVPLIQNLGIEIQRAKNMHKFRSIVYLLIAASNIFVSYPLCKRYGAAGAAVGTAITLTLGNIIIMNIYYHKRVGINMIYFWKHILKFVPALIPTFIFSFIVMGYVTINSVIEFIVLLLAFAAVYMGSMWLFGMSNEERLMFKKPLERILKARRQ